jgi:hypothetical protein
MMALFRICNDAWANIYMYCSLKEALHSEISGDYRTLLEKLLAAAE